MFVRKSLFCLRWIDLSCRSCFLKLINKAQLECITLLLLVPGLEVPALAEIDLNIGNFEANRLIGLRSHEQVLVLRVWLLYALLVCRHKAILGLLLEEDLWVLDLEQERFLVSLRILLLDNFVARLAYFLDLAPLRLDFLLRQVHTLSLLSQLPSMQVRLVLFARCMRQIGVFRGMQRETEPALEAPQVISQNVRVVCNIQCFNLQLSNSLFPDPF